MDEDYVPVKKPKWYSMSWWFYEALYHAFVVFHGKLGEDENNSLCTSDLAFCKEVGGRVIDVCESAFGPPGLTKPVITESYERDNGFEYPWINELHPDDWVMWDMKPALEAAIATYDPDGNKHCIITWWNLYSKLVPHLWD